MAAKTITVTKEQIEQVLRTIPDPELHISIWDLGLIYDISIAHDTGTVTILMTLTSIGCPLFSQMEAPIKDGILAIPGVKKVVIDLTFEPPWTADRMTDEAKAQLGFL